MTSDRDLIFSLTAKDDKGASSTNDAIVTITVKHVNHPPVTNAVPENQVVNPGDIVTLDGSKSTRILIVAIHYLIYGHRRLL